MKQVLFEEDGAFRVGTILSEAAATFQVEAAHGKRSKIHRVLELIPPRLAIRDVNTPLDRRIIERQLFNDTPLRVQPIHPKTRGLSLDSPVLVLEPLIDARRPPRRFRAYEISGL